MKYLVTYGKPRYLGIIEYDKELARGETILAETMRGEELAVVIGSINAEQEAAYRAICNSAEHGDGMMKQPEPAVNDASFIACATDVETEEAEACREEEITVLRQAREILPSHHIDMKLIDVEFIYKKRKLFFYYSAENRVDFRAYVRDLAHLFRTRIEMRQIGVRDEAKIIKGVAPCGRPCCCSYWLVQFAPIGIKMVKEQNLALNPTKISGICGRLMCCLSYEHPTYSEAWEGLPTMGTKLKTPEGNVIVTGISLPTNSLVCTMPLGGLVNVPKEKFEEFKRTVEAGKEWAAEKEKEEPVCEPLGLVFKSEKKEKQKENISEDESKGHRRRRKRPGFIEEEPEKPIKRQEKQEKREKQTKEVKNEPARKKHRKPKKINSTEG